MGRAEDIFAALVDGGHDAVDRFIDDATSEELFLDFKRSADGGSGSRLHADDRANLARAISGFGNSEGGVIVWGVECSPNPMAGDVARAKFPLDRPARFKSWLEGAISGLTVPSHGGVQNHVISDQQGHRGYVATLIPMSDHPPHQTVKDQRYYMRAGSSFLPVPHAVLAGMFGRRPQPHVFQAYTLSAPNQAADGIKISLGVMLHNAGPGIAGDIFLNLAILGMPGNRCGAEFAKPNPTIWLGQFSLGRKLSVITKPEIRLAPDAELLATEITITLKPPFDDELFNLSGSCGCGGAPLYRFEISRTADEVHGAVEAYLGGVRQGRAASELRVHTDTLFRGDS